MQLYEFETITARQIDAMREKSMPDAPWLNLPGNAIAFLSQSFVAGVAWKIHPCVYDAYIQPKGAAQQKRQEEARNELKIRQYMFTAFPSGIGRLEHHTVGRYDSDAGDDAPGKLIAEPDAAGKERMLAEVFSVFWPDAPPLVWHQTLDLLVRRDLFEERGFYGGTKQMAEDTLDFGRVLRCLTHANKLTPHPVVDWAGIINPPVAPSVAPAKRKKP